MNIVFLIGNGFDLNLGLDTSYPKFYEWYDKQVSDKESVQLFKQALKEEKDKDIKLWSDLELFIGEKSILFNNTKDFTDVIVDVNNKLRQYISIQDTRFTSKDDEAVNLLKYDLCYPGEHLANRSKTIYRDFVKRWNGFNRQIDILSFNYTSVFEKILGSTNISIGKNEINDPFILRSIKHIHGSVDKTILLGVDNVDQIKNDKFKNDYSVQCKIVKPIANYSTESMVDEECAGIINNANLICVFGCSLGPTDDTWWRLIKNRIQSDKGHTLLLLMDYDFDKYNLKEREYDRGVLSQGVINKFISKEFADIKGNILVGLNASIFNISSHCVVQQKDSSSDNVTQNDNNSFWKDLFGYDSISNDDFEIMLRKVEFAFKKGNIPLSFVEFTYAIIRLAEIDSNVSSISNDLKNNIKLRLKERLDVVENLEDLNEITKTFSANVRKSGISDDNNLMNDILNYYKDIIATLQENKKGKLVIELESVNNDNVDTLRYTLKETSYNGSSYQYFPVFDKVDIDRFVDSIFKLTNESKKKLRWFFEQRYLLDYRFEDDKFVECKSEVSNLSRIISNMEKRMSNLVKIDRTSTNELLRVIRLSKKRCEGNKEVLIGG